MSLREPGVTRKAPIKDRREGEPQGIQGFLEVRTANILTANPSFGKDVARALAGLLLRDYPREEFEDLLLFAGFVKEITPPGDRPDQGGEVRVAYPAFTCDGPLTHAVLVTGQRISMQVSVSINVTTGKIQTWATIRMVDGYDMNEFTTGGDTDTFAKVVEDVRTASATVAAEAANWVMEVAHVMSIRSLRSVNVRHMVNDIRITTLGVNDKGLGEALVGLGTSDNPNTISMGELGAGGRYRSYCNALPTNNRPDKLEHLCIPALCLEEDGAYSNRSLLFEYGPNASHTLDLVGVGYNAGDPNFSHQATAGIVRWLADR